MIDKKFRVLLGLSFFVAGAYAVILAVSVNTMFLYVTCGEHAAVVGDDEERLFRNSIKEISEEMNTRFIEKSIENFYSPSANPYRWNNYGFCNAMNCISASNDFKKNTYHIFVYRNSMIPFGSSNRCDYLNNIISKMPVVATYPQILKLS